MSTETLARPKKVDEADRFGNLREPVLPTLFGLPLMAWGVLLIAAMAVMGLSFVNIWAALGIAVLAVLLVLPAGLRTKEGYNRYEARGRRRRHKKGRRQGTSELRQGVTGAVPGGVCHLPGVGAATGLSQHVDNAGRPYGLLHWPNAQLYSVVLQCGPSGFDGVDMSTQNDMGGFWAGWLSSLNTVPELVGASVTIETVPDSGQRLVRAMDRGRLEDQLTEFSAAVEQAVLQNYRMGSPALNAWITLSLTAVVDADDEGRGLLRGRDEMAELIGDLLPGWTTSLAPTGAGGQVYPSTAQQIIDTTRVAYDPSIAVDVEEAVLSGEGTGLGWEDVGPMFADPQATSYRHEGAISRTWEMRTPPRGVFYATTLQGLLAPHKDVPRKRVTILYRPETPAASAAAAEGDVTKAMFKASQGRTKAVAQVELEAAQQTARQEAQGAPLVRAALLVTATCEDDAALRRAARAVKGGLAAKARLILRTPAGAQDTAFLMALPLGLVPQTIQYGPVKEPKARKQKEW